MRPAIPFLLLGFMQSHQCPIFSVVPVPVPEPLKPPILHTLPPERALKTAIPRLAQGEKRVAHSFNRPYPQ
jgi:hypothetical protein